MPQPPPSISLSLPSLATQFGELLTSGHVQAGDGVLYRYARPDRVQRLIARIQARALEDLGKRNDGMMDQWHGGDAKEDERNDGMMDGWKDGNANPTIPPFHHSSASSSSTIPPFRHSSAFPSSTIPPFHHSASAFTHAGMVLDLARTVEMTSPRCRATNWEARLQGIGELAVIRPANAIPATLSHAAREALAEVTKGTNYPYRELLLYWLWSWGWRKLRGRTPFATVFRDRARNVCSGSLIQWWRQAGIDLGLRGTDAWPEAWYPARFLVDRRFHVVARLPQAGDRTATSVLPSLDAPGTTGQWAFPAPSDSSTDGSFSSATVGSSLSVVYSIPGGLVPPFACSSVRACPSPSVFVPPTSGNRLATPPLPVSCPSLGTDSGGTQARTGVDEHGHPSPDPLFSFLFPSCPP